MTTAIYERYGLDQTVHVGSDGSVKRGVNVKHEAANLQCNVLLDNRRDPESGVTYPVVCHKRAGHRTPKGEEKHVSVDVRLVAAPYRVAHSRRFMPNGIPAGVDQSITLPHDCANHLD